ncbi:thermonuclease family protein [Nitratifractor sp.]|uniref:thermonuclease family protein n=1 Tax=Nitratifractor sp. TaxID=2268144 RepID=UPI0025E21269|nr:thermonuclease family protein [Nitratifractor sp.]
MGRWILTLFMLGAMAVAQTATLVKVQSENRLVLERDGKRFTVRLAGIASFATAGDRQKEVPWQLREKFSHKAQEFLLRKIPVGTKVHYGVIDDGERGATYVWLYDEEVNYRMVREGYALVDSSDPYLPGQLEMRMKMAMKYAKSRSLGLWKESPALMAAMRVSPWYRTNATAYDVRYAEVEKRAGRSVSSGAEKRPETERVKREETLHLVQR